MQRNWIRLCLVCFLFFTGAFSFFHITLNNSVSSAQEELDSLENVSATRELKPGHITVDFKDADIHDVLKIISYKSGVNIVAGQDVAATITIRLVDVPWERALDVILKNSNFVYERDKDIIRVTTVENLSKEELSTQLFTLNYANAQQAAEAVQEMLSARGKVKFDERTNQLVISDIPTNLYKLSKVVASLDKKTPQVMIEARVIETVLDDDERLGIDWTLYASATGAARPLVFPFAFSKTYGKTGQEYFPQVDTSSGSFSGSVQNGFPYAASTDFSFGTLSFTQLQTIIEILKTRSNTKTLSNPKIVTVNNQEAVIHVGRDYNIPLYERNSSTGQMEITDYKTQQVGIKLTVTPHVNSQGEIMAQLHPEVSSFLQFDDYGNVKAPVFTTREARTQVMVKNGETIVIGGLIKEETVDYVKKIPILGDLPLLKYVFSKTTKTVDTTDLLIFVTVTLLDSNTQELKKQARLLSEE